MYCPHQETAPRTEESVPPYRFDQRQLDSDIARRTAERERAWASKQSKEVTTATATNYSEYYLGKPGQSCTDACRTMGPPGGLKCNYQMDQWDPDTMKARLNVRLARVLGSFPTVAAICVLCSLRLFIVRPFRPASSVTPRVLAHARQPAPE